MAPATRVELSVLPSQARQCACVAHTRPVRSRCGRGRRRTLLPGALAVTASCAAAIMLAHLARLAGATSNGFSVDPTYCQQAEDCARDDE